MYETIRSMGANIYYFTYVCKGINNIFEFWMPIEIKRQKAGTFQVYSRQEADELGMVYKPWYEVEMGDYALSDDDYVSEVLSVGKYKSKGKDVRMVSLPYGRFWVGRSKEEGRLRGKGCNFQNRHEARAYYNTSDKNYGEWILAKRKIKKMIRIAAVMMIERGEINYDYLGTLFFSKDKIPVASVRRVFKQKEVRQYMEEQIEQKMAKAGFTDDEVFSLFRDSINIARNNQDADLLLKNGIELAKMKGFYPTKKTTTNEIQYSRNTEYIDQQLERSEEQIRLAQRNEE